MAASSGGVSTGKAGVVLQHLTDRAANRLNTGLAMTGLTGAAYVALLGTAPLSHTHAESWDYRALMMSNGLLAASSVLFLFAVITTYCVVQHVAKDREDTSTIERATRLFEQANFLMPLGFTTMLLALPGIAFHVHPSAGAAMGLYLFAMLAVVRDLVPGVLHDLGSVLGGLISARLRSLAILHPKEISCEESKG